MADEKLTALTETTDLADTDLLYAVINPATVPESRGIQKGNVITDASTTVAGKVELSTTDEAMAGTDTTRAVTPAGLIAGISNHFGGELLDSTSFTDKTTVTFDNIPQTHTHLLIRGYGLYTTSDASALRMNLNSSTDNYGWGQWGGAAGGAAIWATGGSTDSFVIMNLTTDSNELANFQLIIYNYAAGGRKGYHGTANNSQATQILSIGGLWYDGPPTPAITKVYFTISTADTFNGNIYLYGFDG